MGLSSESIPAEVLLSISGPAKAKRLSCPGTHTLNSTALLAVAETAQQISYVCPSSVVGIDQCLSHTSVNDIRASQLHEQVTRN